MRSPFRAFAGNQAGSLTTLFALSIPAIGGAVALAIDVGRAELAHKQALRAAEASAVSAAVAYQANSSNDLVQEATQVAAKFGFTSANGSTISVNRPPSSGPNATDSSAVEVIISQPQPSYFASLVWPGAFAVTGRAVARGGPNVCLLALDPSASGAVGVQGSANVAASKCSVFSNSSSASSVSAGGSSSLSSRTVSTVGNISGQSQITTTNGMLTGQSATPDPYASLSMPSFSGCTATSPSYQYTNYLLPGVYCGGMTLNSGAVVTLSPGVYIMDQGQLTVNGGATLQGTGVTIIFTSSTGSNYATAKINGGATINLTAPTTGPYAGIVVYGDRNMPSKTGFNFIGGSAQYFGGVMYLPNGAVSYAGNSASTSGCTQVIVDTINFSGSSTLAMNCAGFGVKTVGAAAKVLE